MSSARKMWALKGISSHTQQLLILVKDIIYKFKDDKEKAAEMLAEKKSETANAETAALTVVANAILNLDEVVTKN